MRKENTLAQRCMELKDKDKVFINLDGKDIEKSMK